MKRYELFSEEVVESELGSYTLYGISVNFEGEVTKISSVGTNPDRLLKFVDLINENDVFPCQVEDLIHDILGTDQLERILSRNSQ